MEVLVRFVSALSGEKIVEFSFYSESGNSGESFPILFPHLLAYNADCVMEDSGLPIPEFHFYSRLPHRTSLGPHPEIWGGPSHRWKFFLLGSLKPLGPLENLIPYVVQDEIGRPCITICAVDKGYQD
jgi:hypothetical protein